MSTLRKQIIDAALVALNTGRPTGVPAATRLRQTEFEASTTPSISIYPGAETIEPATNRYGAAVKRSLQLVVEVRASGTDPDILMDASVGWAEKALASWTSSLIHDVVEDSVTHEFAIGTVPIGVCRVVFYVRYSTRRTDPSAAS